MRVMIGSSVFLGAPSLMPPPAGPAHTTPRRARRAPPALVRRFSRSSLPRSRAILPVARRHFAPPRADLCQDRCHSRASMKVLILGVNGFIGHHLTARILAETDWKVYGMDLSAERLEDAVRHPRFEFVEGDISINKEWIEYHIKKSDVVLPLVAIATPKAYVERPLEVFELDFEENLRIVRQAVRYGKRIVFPSTSEVYGMSDDAEFDEDSTKLVLGPISKERWIYSCSKQLLDRVIWAYGRQGLRFTLIRPFNWIGPRLDSLETAKEGSSRVVTQFMANLVMGLPIQLVDGGQQRRCFTYVDDGISALMKVLENRNGAADGGIFNIGSPENDCSVRELAEM